MSDKNTFSKVERSDDQLYGPRSIIVTGYPVTDQDLFLEMLAAIGLPDLPVKFISEILADQNVGAMAAMPQTFGQGMPSSLPRAVIMSGITENELHHVMNAYRAAKLPASLWATLTPISEKWALSFLLEELAAERAAFEKRSQKS